MTEHMSLEQIIRRACAFRKEDRFKDVGELKDALQNCLERSGLESDLYSGSDLSEYRTSSSISIKDFVVNASSFIENGLKTVGGACLTSMAIGAAGLLLSLPVMFCYGVGAPSLASFYIGTMSGILPSIKKFGLVNIINESETLYHCIGGFLLGGITGCAADYWMQNISNYMFTSTYTKTYFIFFTHHETVYHAEHVLVLTAASILAGITGGLGAMKIIEELNAE